MIKTNNLTLRTLELADANEMHNYLTQANVCRMAGINPSKTKEQSIEFVKILLKEKAWVVQKGGRVIGNIVIFKNPSDQAQGEIGFMLNEDNWHHGYMQEALGALLKSDEFFFNEILAVVYPENIASIKTLEKVGFEFETLIPKSVLDPQIKVIYKLEKS